MKHKCNKCDEELLFVKVATIGMGTPTIQFVCVPCLRVYYKEYTEVDEKGKEFR